MYNIFNHGVMAYDRHSVAVGCAMWQTATEKRAMRYIFSSAYNQITSLEIYLIHYKVAKDRITLSTIRKQ